MPVFSLESLSLLDAVLLAVILLGLPAEAFLSLKKTRTELAENHPGVRVKHYTHTILILCGLTVPILILWAVNDRSWGLLGFQVQYGWIALAGWGLMALVAGFFLYQYFAVSGSETAKQQYRDGLANKPLITDFMPHTEDERRVFNLLGVTAGVAEEIIFRGFLIWALAVYLPLWMAALAALLVFTVLHLYQGVDQLPTIFLMGGLVTIIFLMSGSLWPVILLHIFVDVINNQTVWAARHVPA